MFLIFWYFVGILLAAEQKTAASRGDDGIRTGFGEKKNKRINKLWTCIFIRSKDIFYDNGMFSDARRWGKHTRANARAGVCLEWCETFQDNEDIFVQETIETTKVDFENNYWLSKISFSTRQKFVHLPCCQIWNQNILSTSLYFTSSPIYKNKIT